MKVTISSVSDRGTHAMFSRRFSRRVDAFDYINDWKTLAADVGVTIRIDTDEESLVTDEPRRAPFSNTRGREGWRVYHNDGAAV